MSLFTIYQCLGQMALMGRIMCGICSFIKAINLGASMKVKKHRKQLFPVLCGSLALNCIFLLLMLSHCRPNTAYMRILNNGVCLKIELMSYLTNGSRLSCIIVMGECGVLFQRIWPGFHP